MRYPTPLRYPGGKSRLANFVKILIRANDLLDGDYVEAYAGGAGIAFALLIDEYVSHIHINDISRPIYAFWHSILFDTETICKRIIDTPVTLKQWRQQKALLSNPDAASLLDLGFAAFFVNRTARSGIITSAAGAIGGLGQNGKWKINARYNKRSLVGRIQRIAFYRDRVSAYNMDAASLLSIVVPRLPKRTLVYLDPPYFAKGQRLYTNAYSTDDHRDIACRLAKLKRPWIMSYDNAPTVRKLYESFRMVNLRVQYSAATRYSGSEVIIFPNYLRFPKGVRPASITAKEFRHRVRRDRQEELAHQAKGSSVLSQQFAQEIWPMWPGSDQRSSSR